MAHEGAKKFFDELDENEKQNMEGSIRVFKTLFMCSLVEFVHLAAKAHELDREDIMLFVNRIFGPEVPEQPKQTHTIGETRQ